MGKRITKNQILINLNEFINKVKNTSIYRKISESFSKASAKIKCTSIYRKISEFFPKISVEVKKMKRLIKKIFVKDDSRETHTIQAAPPGMSQQPPQTRPPQPGLSQIVVNGSMITLLPGQRIEDGEVYYKKAVRLLVGPREEDIICLTDLSKIDPNKPKNGERCFRHNGLIFPDRQVFELWGKATRAEYLSWVDGNIADSLRREQEALEREQREEAERQAQRQEEERKAREAVEAEQRKPFVDAHKKFVYSVEHIRQNDARFPFNPDNIRIAFIGDKGSGKASLINFLLGEKRLPIARGYIQSKTTPIQATECECRQMRATLIYTPGNIGEISLRGIQSLEEAAAVSRARDTEHGYINGEFIKHFQNRTFDMAVLTIAPLLTRNSLEDPSKREFLQREIFDTTNEVMLKILMATNKPFIIVCARAENFSTFPAEIQAEEQLVLATIEQTCREKMQKVAAELGLRDFDVSKVKVLCTFKDKVTKKLKLSRGGDLDTIRGHIREVMESCRERKAKEAAEKEAAQAGGREDTTRTDGDRTI